MQFISWVEMQRLMTWWHDDMMQCKNKRASTKEAHGKTQNSWKSSGASVSGRHNTPPLREDLVPRSRMAPERNGRGREEVKLSCFFDKRAKPRTLRGWKVERKNTTELKTTESTAVENRNNEHHLNHGGCKAMNDEYNGQEGMETTLVEMR